MSSLLVMSYNWWCYFNRDLYFSKKKEKKKKKQQSKNQTRLLSQILPLTWFLKPKCVCATCPGSECVSEAKTTASLGLWQGRLPHQQLPAPVPRGEAPKPWEGQIPSQGTREAVTVDSLALRGTSWRGRGPHDPWWAHSADLITPTQGDISSICLQRLLTRSICHMLASIPVSPMAYDIQYPLADKRRKGEERWREGRRWEGSSREKDRKEISKLQMPLHCTLSSPSNKDDHKHSLESSN